MIVLKYFVFGVLIVGTCRALNFKDIKAKIQKRKGFSPSTPKHVKALKPPIVVPLKNNSDDAQSSTAEEPQVTILESKEFSTTMTLTAAVVLRKAVNLFPSNPCEILGGFFERTYSEYEWQCVDYNMVAVGSRKSINLEVEDKKYLLFATNKKSVVDSL